MVRKIFILLCLTFFLVSCDNGDMETEDLFSGDNPLIGTWEIEGGSTRFVFTETNANRYFTFSGDFNNPDAHSVGTYTFDGRLIIIAYTNGLLDIALFYDADGKFLIDGTKEYVDGIETGNYYPSGWKYYKIKK